MHQRHFLTREGNLFLLFGFLGIAIGWITPLAVEQATGGKKLWLILASAPIVVPVLLFMLMRPVFGALAVVGFAFVHPSWLPPLMELGPLSVRYFDVVFALLICTVLARIAVRRGIAISPEFWKLFAPLLLFFLYVGGSLAIVPFSAPDSFSASVSSYMRLILTASFAPVLHLALRDERDMHVFQMGLIFLVMATLGVGAYLVWAGFERGEAEVFAGRFGGVLGTGSFGLVSGLLLLYAFIKRDANPRPIEWGISFVLGSLGLFLAKTVSSMFAAAGAVTLYLAAMRSRRGGVPGLLKLATIGTIMTTAAAVAVWIFRQDDASGFVNLSGGSFAHRLMIAYAGIQIFLDNPLIGVGWQASTAEAVVGSSSLNAALMEKFPQLPAHYFFRENLTTLHNMYIQFLAELGIIGFALFAWVCFRTGKNVARIVKGVPAGSPYKASVQLYALGLIFFLIWWNNNPLYGGQTESILAVTFVALLANVAELEKQRQEYREAR